VTGTVSAKQVRLYGTSVVEGDITHEQLAMESGAQFQGRSLKFQRPAPASGAQGPPAPQAARLRLRSPPLAATPGHGRLSGLIARSDPGRRLGERPGAAREGMGPLPPPPGALGFRHAHSGLRYRVSGFRPAAGRDRPGFGRLFADRRPGQTPAAGAGAAQARPGRRPGRRAVPTTLKPGLWKTVTKTPAGPQDSTQCVGEGYDPGAEAARKASPCGSPTS
jgi:hypothetical protein